MIELPAPARYAPWSRGVYDVAPGLKPFGTDFGNGVLDQRVFQIDRDWERYLLNKRSCLLENPAKYVLRHKLLPTVEAAVAALIASRLVDEYPGLFVKSGAAILDQRTGSTLPVNLDDLALLLPEDFAIVQRDGDRDWIAYLNLCSPSHWGGEDKIGKSFFETHVPVSGFERTNAVAPAMVDAMIHRGPFVRFVWGVESDDRLNHHPKPPPAQNPGVWHGRRFEEGRWVRVERQVVWGLPELDAALFTIRVSHWSGEELAARPDLEAALEAALETMSPDARRYKGLTP